jgi:hypothetical protein
MKRLFVDFFMGSVFSAIGFLVFSVAFSVLYHFLYEMLKIELTLFGDKGKLLFGVVFGLPIGGISGILFAEKLVYRSQGWNILGIVLGVLLSCVSVWLGIHLMDKTGSAFIFLIPLLIGLTCLFGYNIGLVFK